MVIMTNLECLLNDLMAHPTYLLAAVTVFSMWRVKDKCELISTPKSLMCGFSSIGVLSGDNYWNSGVEALLTS